MGEDGSGLKLAIAVAAFILFALLMFAISYRLILNLMGAG